jgi:hypothetical protein
VQRKIGVRQTFACVNKADPLQISDRWLREGKEIR